MAFPLPSFVGDRPQSLDWAFGRFTLEVEPRRIVFREPLMLPGNAGILSQPFLRTLSDCWRVRPTYSKSAGYAYLGITCPKCGSLQGDNFVYDNYQGRGGVFSDPEDKSPLEVLPLPVFTDDWPQRFHWAFDSFSLDLEPWRIRFGKPVAIWGNAWPWSE